MKFGGYNDASEVEAGLHVVAGQIAKDYGVTVNFHNGSAVDADIFKKVIRVPRLSCSSEIPDTALMLVRAQTYHEAGHCGKTIIDRKIYEEVKGSLFKCWNAIEDCRMEHEVGIDYIGCANSFREKKTYYNQKIGCQIADEGVNAPLWEALCAMSFKSLGVNPSWTLTDKAQAYFDAGREIFMRWYGCKTAYDALELAKELHEALKECAKDYEEEQEPEEGGEDSQPNDSGESEEQDDNTPQQSSDSGDLDEDEDSEDGDSSSDGDESDEGEGEEDEDESEGDEDDSDSDSDSDSDEGEDSDGSSSSDEDDDEDLEDGSDGNDSDDESEEDDAPEHGSGSDSGDLDEEESDEEEEDTDWDKVLDEDSEGGLEEDDVINEEISKMISDIDMNQVHYLSYREDDYVIVPDGGDSDKKRYQKMHSEIAGDVMGLTYGLEQALRAMSQSRRKPYLRQGKIDKKRYTHIGMGLSKEVFYKTQEGMTLDTAVFIIVDESGSMDGITEETKKTVMAIGEAMNGIGVPFAVCGSTTKYWGSGFHSRSGFNRSNPIEYRYYKAFSEPWMMAGHRVMNIGAHKHNVDGEVIEFAACALSAQTAKRKIIISINDGEPCSGEYNDEVLAQNLIRVCNNVRESGTEVYGFGIGDSRPAKFYGEDNFIYLAKDESMGADFVNSFANILTGGMVKV